MFQKQPVELIAVATRAPTAKRRRMGNLRVSGFDGRSTGRHDDADPPPQHGLTHRVPALTGRRRRVSRRLLCIYRTGEPNALNDSADPTGSTELNGTKRSFQRSKIWE